MQWLVLLEAAHGYILHLREGSEQAVSLFLLQWLMQHTCSGRARTASRQTFLQNAEFKLQLLIVSVLNERT